MSNFHVIIPARYHSTRLPGKVLLTLNGMTILERVYCQALKACPKSIVIATDNPLVEQTATAFGAEVVLTGVHQSGTDRIAEVIRAKQLMPSEIIVNVQADEPFIAPELIQQVAKVLTDSTLHMASLCWPISDLEEFNNPNVVKVVRDEEEYALYFSRSPIPMTRENPLDYTQALKHIGLYAYRAKFLLDFVNWPMSSLEKLEHLEQLRALTHGQKIKIPIACQKPMQDVNTPADLERARKIYQDLSQSISSL